MRSWVVVGWGGFVVTIKMRYVRFLSFLVSVNYFHLTLAIIVSIAGQCGMYRLRSFWEIAAAKVDRGCRK